MLNEWVLDYYEPILLEDYENLLKEPINYKIGTTLIYLCSQFTLYKISIKLVLTKKTKTENCGYSKIYRNGYSDIILHKGYFNIGVLMHELAHIIVCNRYQKDTPEHGYLFKGWFIFLVRYIYEFFKNGGKVVYK